MLHWLHHIVFDPLSAWEKFWLDILGSLLVVTTIFAVLALAVAFDRLKREYVKWIKERK